MADETVGGSAAKPITGKAITTGREPGFRPDGTAYPGVDPYTGERKALTWDGAREEFGERIGARLYNDVAKAAFGGVQAARPALSLITLDDAHAKADLDLARQQKRRDRAAKVAELIAAAEKE